MTDADPLGAGAIPVLPDRSGTVRRRRGPGAEGLPGCLTSPSLGWVATLGVIAGLLTLDWLLMGRRAHAVGLGGAARWSLFYVLVSVVFGVVFALLNGWDLGAQFFAGYVVEKSLSVDNLFVFVIIIGAFAVPSAQQPKVLTIGIVIALVLRALFIAARRRAAGALHGHVPDLRPDADRHRGPALPAPQ